MTTRPDVRAAVIREFGSFADSLEQTSGSSGTITLPNAWRANGASWAKRQLVLPDAAVAANRVREVTAMTRGVATLDSPITNIAAGARFELYPRDVSEGEINVAISQTLTQTKRPVTLTRTMLAGQLLYEMPAWLADWNDIRAVFRRSSPCIIDNEDFSSWVNGWSAIPTGWAAADIVGRRADDGSAELRLRLGTGTFTQEIPIAPRQDERRMSLLIDADLTGTATLAVGSLGSVTLEAGRNTTTLDVTVPDGDVSTTVTIGLDGDTTLNVYRVLAAWGTEIPEQLQQSGSDSYQQEEVRTRQRAGRARAAVELSASYAEGQMLIHVLAPFADLTNDFTETEAGLRLLTHGAIFKLADREVDGRESSVWDARLSKHGGAYTSLASRLLQQPVPRPARPVTVWGA